MISEATQHDWEDFWYSLRNLAHDITNFEKVWKEMDEIEPLTPVTQSQENLKFLTNCEVLC